MLHKKWMIDNRGWSRAQEECLLCRTKALGLISDTSTHAQVQSQQHCHKLLCTTLTYTDPDEHHNQHSSSNKGKQRRRRKAKLIDQGKVVTTGGKRVCCQRHSITSGKGATLAFPTLSATLSFNIWGLSNRRFGVIPLAILSHWVRVNAVPREHDTVQILRGHKLPGPPPLDHLQTRNYSHSTQLSQHLWVWPLHQ